MHKKKIALVSPKNPFGEGSALGVLSLATNAAFIPNNYEVVIVDQNFKEEIPKEIDLVGLTVNTITAKKAYDLSDKLRTAGIPTVLGGVHPSVIPEEAIQHASAVVVGEGESIWKQLLYDFENNNLEGKIYFPESFDMSKSRIPRRELLNGKSFLSSLQTSRGCPENCEFCSVTKLYGAKYKYKPLELIEEELSQLKGKRVFLVDDNFYGKGKVAEKRAKNLMKLLKKADLKYWIGQTSMNIANNPEILRLAKESGAVGFYIGFESLNKNFLNHVSKRVNLKQVRNTSAQKEHTQVEEAYIKVIKTIQNQGIGVFGSFIYGTDYDTNESLGRLREFIVESRIDTTYVKPLTPFPGTRIYDRFKEQGRLIGDKYWMQEPYPVFTFKPENLSFDDLMKNSKEFIGMYNFAKSLKYFVNSLKETKSFDVAVLSFVSNLGDNLKYKSYMKEHETTLKNLGLLWKIAKK